MNWKKITLVGVGLLGGSLGMALRQGGCADSVTGYVRRKASIRECLKRGAVDRATVELESAVSGADLVILCTPVAQMTVLAQRMLPFVKRGAVVTDVGSVKGSVTRPLETILGRAGAYFIGSHPMAGSEQTGVSAARPDLFQGSVCILTPTARSHQPSLAKVRALWREVGCRLVSLTPKEHDLLVSRSSHLPHIVAAQLVNLVLRPGAPPLQQTVCANGFRDTTRVASGSPEMWRDICLANRRSVSRTLAEFQQELRKFARLVEKEDAGKLMNFFAKAKERRDSWNSAPCGASPE